MDRGKMGFGEVLMRVLHVGWLVMIEGLSQGQLSTTGKTKKHRQRAISKREGLF